MPMRALSRTLNLALHPMLAPTYAVLLTFNTGSFWALTPLPEQLRVLAYTLSATLLIPFAAFKLSMRLFPPEQVEPGPWRRQLGAMVFAFCLLAGYWGLGQQAGPYHLALFMLTLAFPVLLVSRLREGLSSLHLTAMGALVGFVFVNGMLYGGHSLFWLSTLVGFSGLLASARIHLLKDEPAAAYLGFAIGLAMVLLLMPAFLFLPEWLAFVGNLGKFAPPWPLA